MWCFGFVNVRHATWKPHFCTLAVESNWVAWAATCCESETETYFFITRPHSVCARTGLSPASILINLHTSFSGIKSPCESVAYETYEVYGTCPMMSNDILQCGSRFPMFTTSNICETMVALANWRNQHSSAIGSNNNNAGPDKFESIQRRFYD